MYSLLPRMLASVTLAAYLLVGVVAYRLVNPESRTVTFSSQYLSYFSESHLASTVTEDLAAPAVAFEEIKIPVVKKVIAKKVPTLPVRLEKIARHELPFFEAIRLSAVEMNTQLPTDLVALYRDLPEEVKTEMVAAASQPMIDEVRTTMAKSEDAEPEFFDYAKEEPAVPVTVPVEAPTTVVQNKRVVETIVAAQPAKAEAEEVAVADLIGFDYSKAQSDVQGHVIPTVSRVTSQPPKQARAKPAPIPQDEMQEEMNALHKGKSNGAELSIQIVGTNFQDVKNLKEFEVRFFDDPGASLTDSERGEVIINENLYAEKALRTIQVLKPGFADTVTDVLLEKGYFASTVPLIEEKTFQSYLGAGPIGAILINLDATTKNVEIDTTPIKIIYLDENLAKTNAGNAQYKLFMGVRVGNVTMSFQNSQGEDVMKTVHVHEGKLTFEDNEYEEVGNGIVSLNEEDLLSREPSPLMASSENVRVFGTNRLARKISNELYKLKFGSALSGARRYIELNHQSEPVFVGVRTNSKVVVPSENFMRHILSNLNGSSALRCMVQVNVKKKVAEVVSGPESATLMDVSTQFLDTDGKFYDSPSEKTRKILFVGESRGHKDDNPDSKINIQVRYQDGTVDYVGSYCSPNSYLVEQL